MLINDCILFCLLTTSVFISFPNITLFTKLTLTEKVTIFVGKKGDIYEQDIWDHLVIQICY